MSFFLNVCTFLFCPCRQLLHVGHVLCCLFVSDVRILIIPLVSSNCSCTIRYLDDVRSLNSSKFGDNVDCIYLIELEIKDSSN
jgi:hypothetical protein